VTAGTLDTPLGPVSLRAAGGRIVALDWQAAARPAGPLEAEGLRQLAAYFAGIRHSFDLPLDWGSGLHQAVRRAMAAIPLGETRSYGQIAAAVGRAGAGGGAGLRGEPDPDPDPLPPRAGRADPGRLFRPRRDRGQGLASAPRGARRGC
jgi:methylated-DNA-[protein]-cysteine S-methyltransferase